MHQRIWNTISSGCLSAMALGVFFAGTTCPGTLLAQSEVTATTAKKTTEPVFRVPKVADQESDSVAANTDGVTRVADSRNLPTSKANATTETPAVLPKSTTPAPAKTAAATARAPHPLDRAVDFAEDALKGMQAEVMDYTAILSKREQVDGVVGPPSFMNIKIRCPRTLADGSHVPFSIYMKFLRPKNEAGREVIWTDGQNDNKLIAHEGSGILRLKKFYLDPAGTLAMRGQRYPIYDAGLENLIIKLIEKAERDRAAGPCTVNYREGAMINKRSCSLIELIHEEKCAPFEFYKAQVFIDDELNLPVRYVSYDWPASPGAEPQLIEEYTYYNVKTNVGLKDVDFDPNNPAYKFPKR